MKIGVVVDNGFDNDIRVVKEVYALRDLGHEVTVLAMVMGEEQEHPGISVERVKMPAKIRDAGKLMFNTIPFYEWFWRRSIRAFLLRNKVEALHVHDLYMSKCAHQAIQDQGQKISLLLDLHEDYPSAVQSYGWTKGWWRQPLSAPKAWLRKEKEYLRVADFIIVLSDYFRQLLIDRYEFVQPGRIEKLTNVIDLPRYETFPRKTVNLKTDDITLFYFGVVASRRGIFETITACDQVRDRACEVNLLIIGPVDKADSTQFHSLLAERPYIQYISWIDLSELPSYLDAIDICICPAWVTKQHEAGVGNKIYQYMYGAKPLIVSDCKPQRTLVEEAGCGIGYKTEEEYVEAIIKLANDSPLRAEMGAAGKKALIKIYNEESFPAVLKGIYQRL